MKGDSRMSNSESDARNEHPEGPATRRPYVKPAFTFERVFETVALACAARGINHTS